MSKVINPILFTIAVVVISLECLMVKYRADMPFNVVYVILVVNFLFFNLIVFPDVRRRYKAAKKAGK